jgi:hypothetical protein
MQVGAGSMRCRPLPYAFSALSQHVVDIGLIRLYLIAGVLRFWGFNCNILNSSFHFIISSCNAAQRCICVYMENHFESEISFDVDPNIDPNTLPLSYSSFEDPFAQTLETIGSLNQDVGLECNVKAFEARYNSAGELELLQVGTRRNLSREENSSRRAAVVLKRFYDTSDELTCTELHIQSPHIKKALREVVKEYPGLNLNSPTIVLRDIPKCLFHFRKEIADYARSIHDPAVVDHINLIQTYAYQQMVDPMWSYMLHMEIGGPEPGLDFPNLWMAFRPGDLIFTKTGGVPRILRFRFMGKTSSEWIVNATYIESDGKNFGHREHAITIKSYGDYLPLTQLVVYPLDHHKDKRSIMQTLYERGLKFTALQGICYRSYTGTARRRIQPSSYEHVEDETMEKPTFVSYETLHNSPTKDFGPKYSLTKIS